MTDERQVDGWRVWRTTGQDQVRARAPATGDDALAFLDRDGFECRPASGPHVNLPLPVLRAMLEMWEPRPTPEVLRNAEGKPVAVVLDVGVGAALLDDGTWRRVSLSEFGFHTYAWKPGMTMKNVGTGGNGTNEGGK